MLGCFLRTSTDIFFSMVNIPVMVIRARLLNVLTSQSTGAGQGLDRGLDRGCFFISSEVLGLDHNTI